MVKIIKLCSCQKGEKKKKTKFDISNLIDKDLR